MIEKKIDEIIAEGEQVQKDNNQFIEHYSTMVHYQELVYIKYIKQQQAQHREITTSLLPLVVVVLAVIAFIGYIIKKT